MRRTDDCGVSVACTKRERSQASDMKRCMHASALSPALLAMSTSAFLQQMLEKRRPIPLIEVSAYMIFSLPSTLVLSRRRMCWNSMPMRREPILLRVHTNTR